jgi:hypothetical protein
MLHLLGSSSCIHTRLTSSTVLSSSADLLGCGVQAQIVMAW